MEKSAPILVDLRKSEPTFVIMVPSLVGRGSSICCHRQQHRRQLLVGVAIGTERQEPESVRRRQEEIQRLCKFHLVVSANFILSPSGAMHF